MKEKANSVWFKIFSILCIGILAVGAAFASLIFVLQKNADSGAPAVSAAPADYAENDLARIGKSDTPLNENATYIISDVTGFDIFTWYVLNQKYDHSTTFLLTSDLVIPENPMGTYRGYAFFGIFDGGNHVITVTEPKKVGAGGMFMHALKINGGDVVVKNLGVRGNMIPEIAKSEGGLIGEVDLTSESSYTCRIESCYFIGDILIENFDTPNMGADFGGIVGYVSNANAFQPQNLTITNCFSAGSYTFSDRTGSPQQTETNLGGIIGSLDLAGNTSITNCFSTMKMSSDAGTGVSGGIYGNIATSKYVNNSFSVSNCYYTGKLQTRDEDYGIGKQTAYVTQVENCYYTHASQGGVGTFKTNDEMQNTREAYQGFTFGTQASVKVGEWIKPDVENGVSYTALQCYFANNANPYMKRDAYIAVGNADTYEIVYTDSQNFLSQAKMADENGKEVAYRKVTEYNGSFETVIPDPILPGTKFVGWKLKNGTVTGTSYTLPVGTSGELSLEPVFEYIEYKITLNLDGGKYAGGGAQVNGNTATLTYTIENPTFSLSGAQRDYYAFRGWTGEGLGSDGFTIDTSLKKDLNFTATWDVLDYSIDYDTSDTTLSWDSYPKKFSDVSPATIPNPVKQGETFLGWRITDKKTNMSREVFVESETSYVLKIQNFGANIYLTPIWDTTEDKIIYQTGGGSIPAGAVSTYRRGITTQIRVIAEREGYLFNGWVDAASPTMQPVQVFTIGADRKGNVVLVAQYTAKKIAVNVSDIGSYRYMTAGGNEISYRQALLDFLLASDTPQYEYAEDGSTVTLPNPVYAYHKFLGWQINGETVFTVSLESPGPFVFSAGKYTSDSIECTPIFEWTVYTITYELESDAVNGAQNPNEYTYNSTTFVLQDAERRGYRFLGWQKKDANGNYGTAVSRPVVMTNSSENLVYKPQWEAIEYNLTYIAVFHQKYQQIGKSYAFVPDGAKIRFTVEDTFTIASLTRTGCEFMYYVSSDLDLAASAQAKQIQIQNHAGDIDLYVYWNLTEYIVSFEKSNLDGDDALDITYDWSPIVFTVETDTFTLSLPVRSKYKFDGWKRSGETVKQRFVTIEKGMVTESRTYVACWIQIDHTITYVGTDGAENPNPEGFQSSAEMTILPAQKNGYRFMGWTCADLGIKNPQATVLIPAQTDKDLTFTANWEIVTYTVTYVLGGGNFDLDTAKEINPYHVTDADFNLETSLSRKGYTFGGWYLQGQDASEAQTVVTIHTKNAQNYIYCAYWKPVYYELQIDLNNGKWAASADNPGTSYSCERQIPLNSPVRAGYQFVGWVGTGIDSETPSMSVIVGTGEYNYTNLKFTANWEAVRYTITYNLSGGVLSEEKVYEDSFTVLQDRIVLQAPERFGYTFVTWNDESGNAITSVDPRERISNVTVSAIWKINEYDILYNNVDDADFLAMVTNRYDVTMRVSISQYPQKRGYQFIGWEGSSEGMTFSIVPGTRAEAIHLTAKWKLISYEITYNLGSGGSIDQNKTTEYTVDTIEIAIPVPTRVGYTFSGWSAIAGLRFVYDREKIDGSGKEIIISCRAEIDSDMNLQNIQMEAEWEVRVYGIVYSDVDADTNENPTYYTIESGIITLLPVKRAGYTFGGWVREGSGNSSPTFTVRIYPGSEVEDLTFTAKWITNVYYITYLTDGGSFAESVYVPLSYNVRSDDFKLPIPEKKGYEFKGWTVNGAELGSDALISKGTYGSLVCVASYGIRTYRITYLDADYGSSFQNPTEYTIHTPTFTLQNPVRRGYTFIGWVGSDIQTTAVTVVIAQGERFQDLIYTAKWEITSYVISYNLNGGEIKGLPNPASYTVRDVIAITNPIRNGYTFAGWQKGGSSELFMSYTIEDSIGALTFAAMWVKNKDYIEIKQSADPSSATLVKIETDYGFAPGTKLQVDKIEPSDMEESVLSAIGDIRDIQYIYALSLETPAQVKSIALKRLSGSSYGDGVSITVSLYGAEENSKLLRISEDGAVSTMDALRQGSYFVFTTDTLSTYAVVKTHAPLLSPFAFWMVTGSGVAAVLIVFVSLLLRFTVFRRYRLTFVGADVASYKIRKGKFIFLPQGYSWFEDINLTRPFAYVKMPPHDVTAYTYLDKSAMTAYQNYTPLAESGNRYTQIDPSQKNRYLGAGYRGLLGDGSDHNKQGTKGIGNTPELRQSGQTDTNAAAKSTGFGFDAPKDPSDPGGKR